MLIKFILQYSMMKSVKFVQFYNLRQIYSPATFGMHQWEEIRKKRLNEIDNTILGLFLHFLYSLY
jgi:hypothetical protein